MSKLFAIVLVVLSVIFIASCSSDSGTNNSGEMILGTLEAKLDGKTWKSQQALASKIGGAMYQITGAAITGATETITLTIPKVEAGTHTGGIGNVNVIDISNPMAGQKAYSNTNVTYTISNVTDEEISGSFSFVATNTAQGQSDTRKVESGRFRVKFVN
ncbi:MAG: hypothetical protein KIT33_11170 [Candidatus Kapabacteria bacterium]|nr:hypothetical protein [Ignavibacteriota bacterium]MCW5885518.1 hypothetical protein [Candidatus Kapabacteria bacterium]